MFNLLLASKGIGVRARRSDFALAAPGAMTNDLALYFSEAMGRAGAPGPLRLFSASARQNL
jgi:hypothetical protein